MNKIILDRSIYNLADTTQVNRFKKMVTDAVANPLKLPYLFTAYHAALGWKLFQIPGADDLACTLSSEFMKEELRLMETRGYPEMSFDSYLYAGRFCKALAVTIDWCGHRCTPEFITLVKNHISQTAWNLAHYDQANWGGVPDIMTDGTKIAYNGWARNDALNNYYYSHLNVHAYDSIVNTRNVDWFLTRLQILREMWAAWDVGLPEGTGYSLALSSLFLIIKTLTDSTGQQFPEIEEEANNVIECWAHLSLRNYSTGKFDEIVPLMDHSREARHLIHDGDRQLILTARMMTKSSKHKAMASWWLGEVSHTKMTAANYCDIDMLEHGIDKQMPSTNYLLMGSAGHFVWRDSWGPGATVVCYASGPNNQAHDQDDQGSFQMFCKGPQTTTHNMFSRTGILNSPNFHNVLCFYDAKGPVPQSTKGICAMDMLSQYEIFMNVTPAYTLASGIKHTRQARHGPGYLWTHDKYSAGNSLDQVWQSNVPHRPVITGNVAKCGNLTIKVLVPANAVLSVVDYAVTNPGDKGYKLEVRGGNGEYIVEQTVDLLAPPLKLEWETATPTPTPVPEPDPVEPLNKVLPLWPSIVTHVLTTKAIYDGKSWHWQGEPMWKAKENVLLTDCVATAPQVDGLPSDKRKWVLLSKVDNTHFVRMSLVAPLIITDKNTLTRNMIHAILKFPATEPAEDPEMIKQLQEQVAALTLAAQNDQATINQLTETKSELELQVVTLNTFIEQKQEVIEGLRTARDSLSEKVVVLTTEMETKEQTIKTQLEAITDQATKIAEQTPMVEELGTLKKALKTIEDAV